MKQKILLPIFTLLMTFSLSLYASSGEPVDELKPVRIELSLYPNPTNGIFYLNIEALEDAPYRVKVVDLIGKEFAAKEVQPNEEVIFDLSTAPRGVYFVQITQGRDQIIKRLVVR